MGWVVNATLRPLTPGKNPVRIVKEAGLAPRPVWTGAENFASTWIPSPDRPALSEWLNRLSYPGRPANYSQLHLSPTLHKPIKSHYL